MKVSFPASVLDARGLVKLGRFYGEDLDLSSWWISLDEKLSLSERMDFVADMAIDEKKEIRPPLICNLMSCVFLEYFCFALILKCGGSDILGLDRRTVKARCDLLHVVNPALLHIDYPQYDFAHYRSGLPGGYALVDGLPLQWRGLDYMSWHLFPALMQALIL